MPRYDGLITNGWHLPYNPNLKERARVLRKGMTNAEKKLWHQCLRRFPLQWYRQKPLDHFIVDFYCPKLRLVVEVDGEIHSSAEARAYDEGRTKILQGYGIKVLRFKNSEVFRNFGEVCKVIETELHAWLRETNRTESI